MIYALINHLEIILKVSTSDLFVSSKPGVSTKQRSSPGNENLMTEISVVKDFRPFPANPVNPVAVSMNSKGR